MKRIWTLELDDDDAPLIGDIVHASAGVNGRVLLADRSMNRVVIVSPLGEIESTVGSKGEGPGEVSGVFRAIQIPDHTIAVADGADAPGFRLGARGDIVLYGENGLPAGRIQTASAAGAPVCLVREMRSSGSQAVVATYRQSISPPLMNTVLELSKVSVHERHAEVVARIVRVRDMRNPKILEADYYEPFASSRVDIDTYGRIAYTYERDRWSVAIRESDGCGKVLYRPGVGEERTADSMERARETMGYSDYKGLLEREPLIRSIHWMRKGCLWVEPFTAVLPERTFACYDEIEADGRLLRRVFLEKPEAADVYEFFLLSDGRLLEIVDVDTESDAEDAAARVVLYELRFETEFN
jgi:hypothetical protein